MIKVANHILSHFAQRVRGLLFLLSLMTFAFCSQSGAALTDGLLAHYSFDDCAENGTSGTPQCESNNTVKDFSGNNHDGTIIGNVDFVYGKVGQAVEFKPYINQLSASPDIQSDYKNAYIFVPNANDLNPNNLTVSLWVYNEKEQSSKHVTPLSIILSLSESFPAYNIEQCLNLNLAINCYTTEFVKPYGVCFGSECYSPPYFEAPYSGDIYGLAYFSPSHSGNKYAFNLISDNQDQPRLYIYPSGEPKVEPKRWYHITYTYDNTTGKVRVYYNGREGAGATHKGGKALAKNANNTVLKIGYPAVTGGFTYTLIDQFPPESHIGSEQWTSAKATNLQFEGKLDEIRIYNRVLSSQEVFELYNQQPNAANWEAVAPINTARTQFAAGSVDGKIYIFGGNASNGDNLKSTETLDLINPTAWSTLADNDNHNGQGVEELTGTGMAGKFYVFGAYGGGTVFNLSDEYNPANNTWTSKANMPTTRSSAVAVAYKNEIFVFGGYVGNNNQKAVEAYNPEADTWRTVTNMPKFRSSPAVAVVDDVSYVIGGALKSTRKAYNNVYAYDFNANNWKASKLTPLPTPRMFSYGHAAPVLNGKIYLIGGGIVRKNGVTPSNKVEIYDPVSNTWQTGPALPNPVLFGATVVANNDIYVISGQSTKADSNIVNNVWKLADAWKYTLTQQETCDLDANGKFSNADAKLFTNACNNKTAYWECDLTKDGSFDSKDTAAYKSLWKNAKKSCKERGQVLQSSKSHTP